MVSEKALLDANYLHASGVDLTPEEVLKLNELGLRAMRNSSNYDDMSAIRRTVLVGDSWLVEPSIYAESWASDVMEAYHAETALDILLVRFCAYVLPADELPKLNDFAGIEKTIKERVFPVLGNLPFSQAIAIQNYLTRQDDEITDSRDEKIEGEDGSTVSFGADGRLHERRNHACGIMLTAKAESLPFGIDDFMEMSAAKVAAAIRQHERLHPETFGKPQNDSKAGRDYGEFLASLEKRMTDGTDQP